MRKGNSERRLCFVPLGWRQRKTDSMKAIQVEDGQLVWATAEDPVLGPEDIKISNRATAINRADLAQRVGGYPPPPGASKILGLECAGVVESVGEKVTGFKTGDEVCALLAGGGYAEQIVVPAAQVLPIPKGLSFTEAAALPEVFATAYLNLFVEGTHCNLVKQRCCTQERAELEPQEFSCVKPSGAQCSLPLAATKKLSAASRWELQEVRTATLKILLRKLLNGLTEVST